jgi:hypothetical protein
MATEHAMQPRPIAASPRHALPGQEPGHMPQPLGKLASGLNAAPRVQRLATLQAAMANTPTPGFVPASNNRTGLPDQLKAGVEAMSGVSLDDVRVHYDSPEPAQLQAHAFARGNDIHLGPGQERHLPHEAWHVVQQAQGRVRPTVQLQGGTLVNDDAGLEHEATIMGARALGLPEVASGGAQLVQRAQTTATAGSVVGIETKPTARVVAPGEVVQGEFAVQVSAGRPAQGAQRRVTNVQFGERPNTQFGSAQEDHVLAWTIKTNEIRHAVMGADNLHDAIGMLVMVMMDTNGLLKDPRIDQVIDHVATARQSAEDDLDLQQILQTGIEQFLIAYNANPATTRKRVGPADRGEGARVRAAKDRILDRYATLKPEHLEDEDARNAEIDGYVQALGNTFQFDPGPQELLADKAKGFPALTQALHAALMAGFSMIGGGELIRHPGTITIRFLRMELTNLGLGAADGEVVLKNLKRDVSFASYLE